MAFISVNGEIKYLSSVYLDIRKHIEEPAWILSIQKTTQGRGHYLTGIDSNSHSKLWGLNTIARGTDLEETLFQHGLCVVNERTKPTFENRTAATCIDITIAPPDLVAQITNWTVQTEMHMSDHHLITMDLSVKPDKLPLRQGRHLKKADWGEFKNIVNQELKD
jgi:hypothetical protein